MRERTLDNDFSALVLSWI
ncbi:BnaC09g14190D [Brassica napus]|uniref:BnaC09g14190D protein n=1 Tax=Brassica napus TaxID=3708 RepID=A0A078I7U0_BRANA|nr:BnaC09g14190D [Brassica napus]